MRPARTSRSQARSARVIPESRAARWAFAGAIACAALLVYSNSLRGPFVFDDLEAIVDNQSIHDWLRFDRVLFPQRELPTAGRPLVNLSFALNYAVGGLNVTGYHVVNIAFHIACALVIFGIIRRTLELPRVWAAPTQSLGIAFTTTFLWTLHPLNTEAVDYVTQRSELMMALCYMLTMYAANRAAKAGASWRWSAIAVAACAAGMLCKESMVTAPVMVALYDRVFLFDSFAQAVKTRRRLYIGLTASWVVAAAAMWSGPRIHSAGFSSGVSPWTYLLNQTIVIARYLRLAVWPTDLVSNYGWPLSLTLREVLPYALLVTGLIAAVLIVLVRRPRWGFLGAWFFVTLAPTSSIVPIATEVAAERRMYLPLLSLVALLVLIVAGVTQRGGRPRRVAALAVLALVSTGLGIATFRRNQDYRSALVLARTAVERYPSSVGHHVFATELILAGDREQARAQLRQALPGAPRAHYTLGVELFRDRQDEAAAAELETFLQEQPMLLEAVSARQLLGRARARQQRWSEAIDQYRQVFRMNPSDQVRTETQAFLGEALYATGRCDEAVTVYSEYLNARPDDVAALNLLGICYLALNKPDNALRSFTRAVSIDPADGVSRRNLANALFDRGEAEAAAPHAEQAARLRVDDPGAWDLLGRVSAVRGNLQDAQADFERALQIDPGFTDAREHLQALRTLRSR